MTMLGRIRTASVSERPGTPARPGRSLTLAVLIALFVIAFPSLAYANGVPKKIVLSYLAGVSNWGPKNATGVAELVPREGEVRLTATGLETLKGDERYVIWALDTKTGERAALGSFKGEGGVARLDEVLPPFPEQDWDLLVVSVEAAEGEPEGPSGRKSIAGRFPIPPTGSGKPSQLPNTGGEVAAEGPRPGNAGAGPFEGPSLAAIVAGLAVSGAVGFGLGRMTSRRVGP